MEKENKIKVFILEDNEFKLQDIIDCLYNAFEDNVEIRCNFYFNESLCSLEEGLNDESFDFAVLDNNVPRFSDSHDLVPNSAENTMTWLELMGITTKCIVCSSYIVKLEEAHDNCLGVVKYSSGSLDWAKQLVKLIEKDKL